MSPRIFHVREHRDKTWYDTHCLEPGQSAKFFGAKNLGDEFKTNMRVSGMMEGDNTYLLFVLGARLIGKTREQEDLLLDHLHVELVIGEKPYYDALGPQISMLRHVFLQSELERLEEEFNAPVDRESDWKPAEDPKWEPPALRVGYHFARPLVIPVKQMFHVQVTASAQLHESVNMRVHLFGLETREHPQ